MSKTFRYVLHEQVPAFAAQGWIAHASLDGTHHGQYSTLMEYVGSSRTTHGASMRPGSHHAPYQTRRDSSFSLPSVLPALASRLHGARGKTDHASLYASSAPFERGKVAKALLDVGALLFVSLYGLLYIAVILGLIPFALFCLFFIQL